MDGNKRPALAATVAFLGLNGRRLTVSNDEAYELVMAVAAGTVDDVDQLEQRIASHLEPWSWSGSPA